MVADEGDTEGGVNAVTGKGLDEMLHEGTNIDGVISEETEGYAGGRGIEALASTGA